MAKLKYNFELGDIQENSETTSMSENVLRESVRNIMAEAYRESERHIKTLMLSERTVISQTSNREAVHKHSPISDVLLYYFEDKGLNPNIGGINMIDDIMSCLSVTEYSEASATTISLNHRGRFESNKFYNIKFNLKKFVEGIAKTLFAVVSTIMGNVVSAIFSGVGAVFSLKNSSTIELDDVSGMVLLAMYYEANDLGIKQNELIQKVQNKYCSRSNISKQNIEDAIRNLNTIGCVKKQGDMIFLIEEIILQN